MTDQSFEKVSNKRPWALMMVVAFCFAGIWLGFKVYRDIQNHKNWTYDSYPNPMPSLEMGDGVPGPNGEPPATIKELVPPILVVESRYYFDGGTTGVLLQDDVGTQAWMCFPPPIEFRSNFPDGFRMDTLYVGSDVPDSRSARLPVSKQEAYMLCRSLSNALESLKDERDLILESNDKNKWNRWEQLNAAFNMLDKLKACKKFHLEKDLKALEEKIRRSKNASQ